MKHPESENEALLGEPAVIASLSEGLVMQDATGRIIASNPSARRILRLEQASLHGRTSSDPVWHAIREDGSDFPGEEHPSMRTLRSGQPLRDVLMGLRMTSGQTTWISINTQPLVRPGEPSPWAVVSSFFEVTEFKRVEGLLRENEERWRSLFEHSLDGVLLTSPDGTILAANRAVCEMLGRSADELLRGGRALVVDREDPRLAAALRERALTGRFRGQLTCLRANGERFPAEISSVLFRDRDGQVRTSMVIRDLSGHKRVERMKDEFISTVSHELRTPLTALHGALRLLEGEVMGPVPEPAHELLRIAAANTQRLTALIDDLLDLERIDSGNLRLEPGPVRASAALAGAQRLTAELARARGIQVRVRVEDEGPTHADARRLEQVLVNLLSNALKFSPEGSTVELVAGRAASGRLRFGVVDQGPGIAPEFLGRIFGRFQQVDASDSRQKGGTGLGLALCKAIVTQHGGDIGVETRPGAGSTFWFELPLSPAPDAR